MVADVNSLSRIDLREAAHTLVAPFAGSAPTSRRVSWTIFSDAGTRVSLAASLGFCRAHAWQILVMERDQCGTALGNRLMVYL